MGKLFVSMQSMRIMKRGGGEGNSRLQEKMRTGKNEVKVISVTITLVSLFCTWPGNRCCHWRIQFLPCSWSGVQVLGVPLK